MTHMRLVTDSILSAVLSARSLLVSSSAGTELYRTASRRSRADLYLLPSFKLAAIKLIHASEDHLKKHCSSRH
jgi:hypothetical protein